MNKRILIFDLSPGRRSHLEQTLSHDFYIIRSKFDSIEEVIAESRPDLIFIRIWEENYSDASLIEKLREVKKISTVPVAVFSSISDIDFYVKCLNAGILYYIKSPIDKEALYEKIEFILSQTLEVTDDEDISILSYNKGGVGYNVSLKKHELVTFLMSTMHNDVLQTKLMQDIVKKKCVVLKSHRDSEILEAGGPLSVEESIITDELQTAINRHQFLLFYQPVMSLKDDTLFGFESLLRWEHPERGIVGPNEFLPILEKTPLIEDLGFWIVEEASRQVAEWLKIISLKKSFRVTVNLSARQFVQEELCERIVEIVSEKRIPSEILSFEITESVFMDDMESANMMLLKLKANNHTIYMDDFGTGYSSLSYLQHFPVDVLKIDKSFVEWMHIDDQSEIIVRTIIDLAHNMKMAVVAEGVEMKEHLDILKKYNCDYAQGFYFSRPLTASDAGAFLKEKNA